MNSEELERSLRFEFESYLKAVLAEMRQEATEFQSRIEADFDKQKAQFDEAFRGFAARFESERPFDEAFSSSVAEHLSLARDEGAKIAANAMVEAEKLGQPEPDATVAVAPKYDTIRDAVADISTKTSQSAILKALVQHAAEFAPRGAFFIIKNEHFVGWKVFGADDTAEGAIRDIHFPTTSDSILGSAVAARSTVDNSAENHAGDAAFLNPLQFGTPDQMYAIPLVARGRGVAVLYVDHGAGGGSDLNREALETLTSVAGLTVELLASMQAAKSENRAVGAADFEDAEHTDRAEFAETAPPVFEEPVQPEARFDDTISEMPAAVDDPEPAGFAFSESTSFETDFSQEASMPNPFDAEPTPFDKFEAADEAAPAPTANEVDYEANPFAESPYPGDDVQEESDAFASDVAAFEPVETESKDAEMIFDSGGSIESAPPVSSSPFDPPSQNYEPAAAVSGGSFGHPMTEPVIDVPVAAIPQPRLSDRHVDLPIEVPEDERRIHNDARRFARLLVSEIKLYNEKKVIEGREASDLYDRLREAIDRSREMYDKRVQPPVAAKFDYFHYEIVNALADGAVERLGAGYPGSSV